MTQTEFSGRVLAIEQRLYRVSFSILRNDADCKDATQEAIYRAWRGLGQMRDERYFETWLISILVNVCKNQKRRAAKHRFCELTEEIPAPRGDDRLHEALFSMEEKHRVPLVLHYLEGYGVEEIAGILKTRPGTVKSWLYYGRKKLRELCEEVDGQ